MPLRAQPAPCQHTAQRHKEHDACPQQENDNIEHSVFPHFLGSRFPAPGRTGPTPRHCRYGSKRAVQRCAAVCKSSFLVCAYRSTRSASCLLYHTLAKISPCSGYSECINFTAKICRENLKIMLDILRISGIITIVPSDTAHEHNRICGYGGIGRRVRFRF